MLRRLSNIHLQESKWCGAYWQGFVSVSCVLLRQAAARPTKLQSISVTPAGGYILTNSAPTGQLTVMATYSNTKSSDVTMSSGYAVVGSA